MQLYEVVVKDQDGDGAEDLTVSREGTAIITIYDVRHYLLKFAANFAALFCAGACYSLIF